jgi:alpha-D-ribose 1-methylphosphonate 5-triphosphate synthase subunit PhnH
VQTEDLLLNQSLARGESVAINGPKVALVAVVASDMPAWFGHLVILKS